MAKILYVDDNEDLRGSFERNGRRAGHEMVVFDDAARGWEAIQRGEKFDRIISDFEMPEMDGLQFLTQVRSNESTRETPFMLISGRERTPDGRSLAEICTANKADFRRKQDISIHDMFSP